MRALWAASVVGGFAQSLGGASGGLLARHVAGTDAVAGLPQSFLVVGAAGSAVAMSWLTPRIGRPAALAGGAGVAAAGAMLAALAALWSNLSAVLIGSILMGAGNTAVMLGRYAAADLGPAPARARAMASVLAATSIGAVAGPNLLGPASRAAAWIGWPGLSGPYVVTVAGFVIATAILAIRFTGPAHHTPATTAPTPPRARRISHDVAAGLVVLGVANFVMVSVMTMAPVHLHAHGVGLGAIGLVVSLHIAGMFGPSPLSGWLVVRLGPMPVIALASVVLTVACALAAWVGSSAPALLIALTALGVGWNLALVSGSDVLTAHSPAADRPRHEGWGELAMGVAAAVGGAGSGVIVAASNYATLAITGAVAATTLLIVPTAGRRKIIVRQE